MGVANHLLRSVSAFARAESGVAAVEFAMLAGPFFWLMLGIFEITMIGFAQTSLDYAMGETARRIRTGVATEGAPVHTTGTSSRYWNRLDHRDHVGSNSQT